MWNLEIVFPWNSEVNNGSFPDKLRNGFWFMVLFYAEGGVFVIFYSETAIFREFYST